MSRNLSLANRELEAAFKSSQYLHGLGKPHKRKYYIDIAGSLACFKSLALKIHSCGIT